MPRHLVPTELHPLQGRQHGVIANRAVTCARAGKHAPLAGWRLNRSQDGRGLDLGERFSVAMSASVTALRGRFPPMHPSVPVDKRLANSR
jgi:hypothetical protein